MHLLDAISNFQAAKIITFQRVIDKKESGRNWSKPLIRYLFGTEAECHCFKEIGQPNFFDLDLSFSVFWAR